MKSFINVMEDSLREFHNAFEQKLYDHPDHAPIEVHKLRARLIEEELKELCAAKDKVEHLDAICDLLYVVVGTAITYSIPLTDHIARSSSMPNIPSSMRLILNDLYTLFPCPNHLRKGIDASIAALIDTAYIHRYKYYEAFQAVHENNMLKLWSDTSYNPNHTSIPKGNRWLVRDRFGKVIKPPQHTKVDLLPYV